MASANQLHKRHPPYHFIPTYRKYPSQQSKTSGRTCEPTAKKRQIHLRHLGRSYTNTKRTQSVPDGVKRKQIKFSNSVQYNIPDLEECKQHSSSHIQKLQRQQCRQHNMLNIKKSQQRTSVLAVAPPNPRKDTQSHRKTRKMRTPLTATPVSWTQNGAPRNLRVRCTTTVKLPHTYYTRSDHPSNPPFRAENKHCVARTKQIRLCGPNPATMRKYVLSPSSCITK